MLAGSSRRPRSLFGQRLERLCAEQGRTLRSLTAKVPAGRKLIYGWRINGPGTKGLRTLMALADELGVSVDWLLGRSMLRSPGKPCPECVALRETLVDRDRELVVLREIRAQPCAACAKLRTDLTQARRLCLKLQTRLAQKSRKPARPPETVDVQARAAQLRTAGLAKLARGDRAKLTRAEIDAALEATP